MPPTLMVSAHAGRCSLLGGMMKARWTMASTPCTARATTSVFRMSPQMMSTLPAYGRAFRFDTRDGMSRQRTVAPRRQQLIDSVRSNVSKCSRYQDSHVFLPPMDSMSIASVRCMSAPQS